MSVHWERLLAIAQKEVESILRQLPAPLQKEARTVPVTYEPVPSAHWIEDEIEPDTMGLFVGSSFAEQGSSASPMAAQIILFLENIWDCAEEDESIYREELRRTFLHELGHFLGLAEDDLEERGLE